MDDNMKWSARKPPLPVDRLWCPTVNFTMKGLLLEIERVHKVKGKWCHNFTKNLCQFVLIKLQSRRPSKKKPDTSCLNLSSLHCIARSLVAVFQIALKVEGQGQGQWSNEYTEDLIQFVIAKLRSSSAPSINNNNNPLAVALHVVTASNS
ncbi:hypothetical protein AAHA92_13580 [Salvia divinorum]|uniref:Uncharacterized protein n=1 Tax=Salvia divinorum TaxID=28513 RepID=A0ABD1H8Q1_SALDI